MPSAIGNRNWTKNRDHTSGPEACSMSRAYVRHRFTHGSSASGSSMASVSGGRQKQRSLYCINRSMAAPEAPRFLQTDSLRACAGFMALNDLPLGHVAEDSFPGHQFFEVPCLYYPAFVQHINAIRFLNGAEPVGHHDPGGLQRFQAG